MMNVHQGIRPVEGQEQRIIDHMSHIVDSQVKGRPSGVVEIGKGSLEQGHSQPSQPFTFLGVGEGRIKREPLRRNEMTYGNRGGVLEEGEVVHTFFTPLPCKRSFDKPIYMTAVGNNHNKRVQNVLYYFLR
jgi:hypothetical protein